MDPSKVDLEVFTMDLACDNSTTTIEKTVLMSMSALFQQYEVKTLDDLERMLHNASFIQ